YSLGVGPTKHLVTRPPNADADRRRSAPSLTFSSRVQGRSRRWSWDYVYLYRAARGRFWLDRQFERARSHFRQHRQREHSWLQALRRRFQRARQRAELGDDLQRRRCAAANAPAGFATRLARAISLYNGL